MAQITPSSVCDSSPAIWSRGQGHFGSLKEDFQKRTIAPSGTSPSDLSSETQLVWEGSGVGRRDWVGSVKAFLL